MTHSTPNYIVGYTAKDAKGRKEECVMLSPVEDPTKALEIEGYKDVKISSVKVNK
jgi:hypothetical protein